MSRPPLGSWPRFYTVTCAVSLLYVVLLYWLTVTFNHAGGPA